MPAVREESDGPLGSPGLLAHPQFDGGHILKALRSLLLKDSRLYLTASQV